MLKGIVMAITLELDQKEVECLITDLKLWLDGNTDEHVFTTTLLNKLLKSLNLPELPVSEALLNELWYKHIYRMPKDCKEELIKRLQTKEN